MAKCRPAQSQSRRLGYKIDITIVVDMLLTGFDSKYLNTLYVDKNLKHHGLIQAFSRTNRVLSERSLMATSSIFVASRMPSMRPSHSSLVKTKRVRVKSG